MDTWDEVRTAFHVARLGTVSGAAEVLGVHHATVIRHIDALEARLGTKLFQRHARGYTPTEAGEDLMKVAQTTEDQFAQLSNRIRGQGEAVSGELVVTSLIDLAPHLTPVLADFQRLHPDLRVRFLTDARVFRLEYGEAHVAVRAGTAPDQPDNVVQPFVTQHFALYAAQSYIDIYGAPESEAELPRHRFVGHDDEAWRPPFYRWLTERVPRECFVYRANEMRAICAAIVEGAGLGFMSCSQAANHPDLAMIMPPREEWASPLWLVTHVDLHRTPKVQAFLKFLKDVSKDWKH